jgi:4-diphosphocytidyl-2-C-methyl-D-erythritol kinase
MTSSAIYDSLMSKGDSLLVRAHAKINLALAVGPPLPPRGSPPIATWFTCIGLCAELELVQTPKAHAEWTLQWANDALRPSPIDWPVEKDLAVRAHRMLELAVNQDLPLKGTLTKRTPVGAGLGGGSADAAAAFVGINDLFKLGLSRDRLRDLSTSLGSDIAFFIDDVSIDTPARPAIVTGFGETIERLDRVGGWVTLIFPPYGCPTGPVYQAFDRAGPGPLREPETRALIHAAPKDLIRAPLFNDLAAPACAIEPRLDQVLRTLRAGLASPVHITGSGSTLFVPAQDGPHAAQLAAEARRLCPEVAALATPLL